MQDVIGEAHFMQVRRQRRTGCENELAARDGARVLLITDTGRNFPLYRLTAERVVSVNTTAADGNASLMMLDS
ncbi:MAG: hypothetical protein ABI363_00195 [Nitrosospira sp.]